jgi:hypothetical protein
MLCGVEDAVAASPRLAKDLNLPVIADLRDRWRTNAEAYEWAFKNLYGSGDEGRGTSKPKLNHHVIACAYPDHIGMRDYFVQHRIFIFWISGPVDGARRGGDPNAEVRLMEKLFAQMPVNIPVMSYPWAGQDVGIGEGPGVTLFSEFGKFPRRLNQLHQFERPFWHCHSSLAPKTCTSATEIATRQGLLLLHHLRRR